MKKLMFLLVLAAPLAVALPVHACSPSPDWPPTPTQNLASKQVAFVGTVTSIVQDKSSFGNYLITFKVGETYKGFLGESVTVTARSSSAACGYDDGYTTFKAGTVWAIYATGNAQDGYETDHLSLNTKYASVAEAKVALEKLGIRPEEPKVCTMEYAPVCGRAADGTVKTFGNACSLNAQGGTLLHQGECPASEVPKRDLSFGLRGADVTWLQRALMVSSNHGPAQRALEAVGATGYFGALTRAALAEFQKAHDITPALGYFGPKTRLLMSSWLEQPTTFTGKIESVDTGCFADGVCSVTVDGKKVVLLTGMRIAPIPPVGSLKGVDSIGDLEGKINARAEVYAHPVRDGDGDFTLYGSTGYYVKVLD
ncbi:MAG TPA: peptidoglycan-binding protein [Candidatus Paceibacterota bacterium]